MFNWVKETLFNLNNNNKLISKRLMHVGGNGKTEIVDTPFTKNDRKNYVKQASKQAHEHGDVIVQIPSTAIKAARYDDGVIYITYVNSDKEYAFKGDDKTWHEFLDSGSKGRFTEYVLKPYHQLPKGQY